jgi:hypothetical protein
MLARCPRRPPSPTGEPIELAHPASFCLRSMFNRSLGSARLRPVRYGRAQHRRRPLRRDPARLQVDSHPAGRRQSNDRQRISFVLELPWNSLELRPGTPLELLSWNSRHICPATILRVSRADTIGEVFLGSPLATLQHLAERGKGVHELIRCPPLHAAARLFPPSNSSLDRCATVYIGSRASNLLAGERAD